MQCWTLPVERWLSLMTLSASLGLCLVIYQFCLFLKLTNISLCVSMLLSLSSFFSSPFLSPSLLSISLFFSFSLPLTVLLTPYFIFCLSVYFMPYLYFLQSFSFSSLSFFIYRSFFALASLYLNIAQQNHFMSYTSPTKLSKKHASDRSVNLRVKCSTGP